MNASEWLNSREAVKTFQVYLNLFMIAKVIIKIYTLFYFIMIVNVMSVAIEA